VVLPDPEGLERDGLSILQALRTRHPRVPVAVFTGVPLSDEQLLVARDHKAIVLHKPQTFDKVLGWLHQALGVSHS
jgi:hypothetical protein